MRINTAKTDGKRLIQIGLVVAVLLGIAMFVYSCSSSEKIRKQEELWVKIAGERNRGRVEFKIDALTDSTVRATYLNSGSDTVVLSTLGFESYYLHCSSYPTWLGIRYPNAAPKVDSDTSGSIKALKILPTYFIPNLFGLEAENYSRIDMILPYDSVSFTVPLFDDVQLHLQDYEDLKLIQVSGQLGFKGNPRETMIHIQDTFVSNCIQLSRD